MPSLLPGDEPTEVRHVTYGEALADTCRLANTYKSLGVRKGDRVCLYMPMVPEAAYCMLGMPRAKLLCAPHALLCDGLLRAHAWLSR